MRRDLIYLLCAAPLSCGYAEPSPDASAEMPKNVGATSYAASAGYAATAGYTADAGYAATAGTATFATTSGSSSPEACGGDMSGTAGSCVVAKISGASPIDINPSGGSTAGVLESSAGVPVVGSPGFEIASASGTPMLVEAPGGGSVVVSSTAANTYIQGAATLFYSDATALQATIGASGITLGTSGTVGPVASVPIVGGAGLEAASTSGTPMLVEAAGGGSVIVSSTAAATYVQGSIVDFYNDSTVAMGSIQTAGTEIGSVTGDFGGCTPGCLGLKTATSVPTSAPTTGGLLYNNNVEGLSSYGVGGFQVLGLAPTGSGTANANFHEQRQAWRGAISGSTTANTVVYGMGPTSLGVSVLRIHVVTIDTASFAGGGTGYGEFVAGFTCPAGGTPSQQGSTTIVAGAGTGGNAPTFTLSGACTITVKLSTTTDAVNATIEVEGLDGT